MMDIPGEVERAEVAICVADPGLADCPLVYVNKAFERLTGYDRADVFGQNCRFLQGPDTDPAEIRKVHEAVRAMRPVTACLRNYRRDGIPFDNLVMITPLTTPENDVLLIGCQYMFFNATSLAALQRHVTMFDVAVNFYNPNKLEEQPSFAETTEARSREIMSMMRRYLGSDPQKPTNGR